MKKINQIKFNDITLDELFHDFLEEDDFDTKKKPLTLEQKKENKSIWDKISD